MIKLETTQTETTVSRAAQSFAIPCWRAIYCFPDTSTDTERSGGADRNEVDRRGKNNFGSTVVSIQAADRTSELPQGQTQAVLVLVVAMRRPAEFCERIQRRAEHVIERADQIRRNQPTIAVAIQTSFQARREGQEHARQERVWMQIGCRRGNSGFQCMGRAWTGWVEPETRGTSGPSRSQSRRTQFPAAEYTRKTSRHATGRAAHGTLQPGPPQPFRLPF